MGDGTKALQLGRLHLMLLQRWWFLQHHLLEISSVLLQVQQPSVASSKLCRIIVDNGSCNNIASQELVDRMELKQRRHPNPYKMRWLNDCGALRVSHVVTVPFSIGRYNDHVECDVVPMQAYQLLLGRP